MAASPLPSDQTGDPSAAPVAKILITKIFVRGLKVEAQIGVYDKEMGRTQPLVVDVELDVSLTGGERLAETLNYELIARDARAVADEGHIALVETYASRLAELCLKDPRVTRARVRVEKPLALAPAAEAAGVEITAVRA